MLSCWVVSDSLQQHGPARLLVHEDSPGRNTGMGFHVLLQGIFPTQGSNPCLLHCRQIIYCLSHQGSPLYRYLDIIKKKKLDNKVWYFIFHKTYHKSFPMLYSIQKYYIGICCYSVAHLGPTLCDSMDCSMPGFPVRYLPEFGQTHVHWVNDAIQPSHPLLSPFPSCPQSSPASGSLLLSWLQDQSFGASASALVLPMNVQSWFPLGLTGLISLLFRGLSGVFSRTTVQKYQFFAAQPPLWSNSHICTWLLEKP